MSEKTGLDKPPESPTTARELDFDDDNDAPASSAPDKAASPPPTSKSPKPGVRFSEQAEEIPPQKPPRPADPNVQAQNTLIEAFPDIDTNVVKAVLLASGGKVEPAFNALLSMSDPNFKTEEAAPPKPPRPQPRSQLEQDEMYARQLAEHYQSQGGQQNQGGYGSTRESRPYARSNNQNSQNKDDREYSFFDDDLPEIRKNIEQGFQETQKTVNKWITSFKKKLDGEPEDYDQYGNPVRREREHGQSSHGRQNYGPSQSDQVYGIRKSAEQRRSGDVRRSADHNRYDADNRVLGDDFAQLELRDNEHQPRSSSRNRPSANPDLFKPTPVSPPQSGPVDEVDALYRNPSPNSQGAKSGGKKWQPLTSIEPNPEADEHDPFSLGDSDDEEQKTKDVSPEDTERLKKAAETKAAETKAEEAKVKQTPAAELKPAERSGSVGQKDAAAEALLKEAK